MNEWSALAAIAVTFVGFFIVAAIIDANKNARDLQIGIECVKAGNEWKTTWGGQYECMRKKG